MTQDNESSRKKRRDADYCKNLLTADSKTKYDKDSDAIRTIMAALTEAPGLCCACACACACACVVLCCAVLCCLEWVEMGDEWSLGGPTGGHVWAAPLWCGLRVPRD